MAEFVMRDEVKRRGLDGLIEAYSSATSYEEYGNPVYPPAVSKMKREGVTIYPHRATPLQKEDYDKYDMFVGMEDYNLRRMKAIFGGDPNGKISKLLDYSDNPRDIADPWYSGNFDRTYLDVVEGVDGLLKFILQHKL
jgi:protein-tyrosine phosphatase